MVPRSVFACALVALTAVGLGVPPTMAHAQESILPRGVAQLVVQVLEIARAVKSSSTSSRRAADADPAADVDSAAASPASAEAEVTADRGVIPYARSVVQLFGRGVPVSPLADLPRGGTTLNVRPCRGGCLFRLRVGF